MRTIYLTLGFLFLGLGAVGTVVPVLPTTPFLLLASFFLSKGSRRFHQWFVNTKLYERHLESFVKHRSMTLKTKISLLSFSSTMLALSFMLMHNIYGRVFIVLVIMYKYYYFICKIKTIPSEKKELTFADDN